MKAIRVPAQRPPGPSPALGSRARRRAQTTFRRFARIARSPWIYASLLLAIPLALLPRLIVTGAAGVLAGWVLTRATLAQAGRRPFSILTHAFGLASASYFVTSLPFKPTLLHSEFAWPLISVATWIAFLYASIFFAVRAWLGRFAVRNPNGH